jgi:hypothetical protein
MIQIILEHPFISFLGLCAIIDGITTIVDNVLRYMRYKKRKIEEK